MKIPFSPPDITDLEINLVIEALKSGWITTGPKTKLLEEKITNYIGCNKTVCLNSATAAMELTLRMLGVTEGDEVILPVYTYTATCSVICHVGATPVFVDISKNSLEMDYDSLSKKITEKTKVIIPVDLAGIVCDYKRIMDIVKEKQKIFVPNNEIQKKFNRIVIMADSAHSFGARRFGKNSGQLADFTCFSFHAVKNLTTAEGGAVSWYNDFLDNDYIYKQYQILSLHGQTKDALAKTQAGAWEYDILLPAYKCNMTDISAAIGLAQLERYSEMLRRRKEIVLMYNQSFKNLNIKYLDHYTNDNESSGHLYILRLNKATFEIRNKVIEKMASRGIATNVHYKPLPILTAYKNMGYKASDYPNSMLLYEKTITLPLYSKLSNEEVKYIIDNFIEVLEELELC